MVYDKPFSQDAQLEYPNRELTLTDIGILLKAQVRILQKIEKILEDAWMLDGTTMTNFFTIPNSWPVVKIDFIEAKHANTPNNTTFEVPLCPVQQIRLKNFGPGILCYSTNKFLNQLEAASKLAPGEIERYKLPKRAMRQINLCANQGACDVRLELLM